MPSPIHIALDRRIAPSAPEAKYALRALLRIAGRPYEFVWADERGERGRWDVYYGPRVQEVDAAVRIPASSRSFQEARYLEPRDLVQSDGLAFLDFGESPLPSERGIGELTFPHDIVLASFWLLTGARELHYKRDRHDNFFLDGSEFSRLRLFTRPLVSEYGACLGRFFDSRYGPSHSAHGVADRTRFAFTHDVDYPQIIRSIESLRLAGRGPRRWPTALRVLTGSSNFWCFSDWIEYTKSLGARPAFYFMARRGSLLRYALGTPDSFYDVRTEQFRQLFQQLRDEGCEIGLHASYHAHRSREMIAEEKNTLEEAAGAVVEGNRHHYWHLDPLAPHATLRKLSEAGFLYDSSLAFEYYPGWRRGVCHPFRVFDPDERRELDLIELPPAWMDDHFDRRLKDNGIGDPAFCAREILAAARSTGGIVVVDYHVRGMNQDFYPRYGRWLMDFMRDRLDSSVEFATPAELARGYFEADKRLSACSRDRTEDLEAVQVYSSAEPSPPSMLRVALLEPDEEPLWEGFVREHPHANIYHSLAWREVTAEGLGHRPYYLIALDGDRATGVLPLFQVAGLFGRRLVSVPMRDRGSVIANEAAVASALIAEACRLTRQLDCRYLELRSLDPLSPSIREAHGLELERYWTTTRIDLSVGRERLWKQLDKGSIRWAVNKAKKDGLRVEIEDGKLAAEAFHELFARTRGRMGIPPFPKALFVSIHRHLISSGKANMFTLWKGSERIHSMINFLSRDTFIPAYAAPQDDWKKHHTSELMLWSTIEWAAEHGFRFYDFGADSPNQASLMWFKRKWGGVHQPMYYYFYLNGASAPPRFDSTSPVYEVARRAWKILPAPAAKALGAVVTRQLS